MKNLSVLVTAKFDEGGARAASHSNNLTSGREGARAGPDTCTVRAAGMGGMVRDGGDGRILLRAAEGRGRVAPAGIQREGEPLFSLDAARVDILAHAAMQNPNRRALAVASTHAPSYRGVPTTFPTRLHRPARVSIGSTSSLLPPLL